MRTVPEGIALKERKSTRHAPAWVKAAAFVALTAAAGCTEAPTGAGSDASSSRPATTATAKANTPHTPTGAPTKTAKAICLPGSGYESSKRYSGGELQLSKLVGVQLRIGEHACYESLVIQLGDDDNTRPGVYARYVDAPIKADPSDKTVKVGGKAFLQINLGASLHDAAGNLIASRTVGPTEGIINEVVVTSDYEGQSSFIVGLDEKLPFTLSDVSGTKDCPNLCEVVNIQSQ
jgi:hypothetical protein